MRFEVFTLFVGSDVSGKYAETSPNVFNVLLVALVTTDNGVVLVVVTNWFSKIRTLSVDFVQPIPAVPWAVTLGR